MQHEIYWSLCFYPSNSEVGLFGGDRDFIKPYLDKSFDLKGEIIKMSNDYIELFILNPYTNDKRIYKGKIEGERLFLKYYSANKPEEIFEDVFQYIGMGEAE